MDGAKDVSLLTTEGYSYISSCSLALFSDLLSPAFFLDLSLRLMFSRDLLNDSISGIMIRLYCVYQLTFFVRLSCQVDFIILNYHMQNRQKIMHFEQANGLKPHFGPFLALNGPF